MGDQEKVDEEEQTIAEDVVVTKYKMAGDMANRVLLFIIGECKVDASARELCQKGDKAIVEETGKVFRKEKSLKKGIAFPTCISVNNSVCHFSPLSSEADVILKDGDMVKIDIGVHVDGFIASVAHTVVVAASATNKVTGRKADVLLAAHTASEVALRLVKQGNENTTVTENVSKVATAFNCKPIEGMLSHQLLRNQIDGEKTIIQNPSDMQRKDHKKCEFVTHEVYAVDVLVSSGDGKSKERDTRTTVYKQTEAQYSLKMKSSRAFFSEVTKFSMMPFTLRSFDDENKVKIAVVECAKHELLQPYPVLWEKDGEYVAQFKFTVLLMANGPMRITQGPWDPEAVSSECSVEDEAIKEILSTSTNKKAQKKKKKKAATKASQESSTATGKEESTGGGETTPATIDK